MPESKANHIYHGVTSLKAKAPKKKSSNKAPRGITSFTKKDRGRDKVNLNIFTEEFLVFYIFIL